jgi:hypothetical protein
MAARRVCRPGINPWRAGRCHATTNGAACEFVASWHHPHADVEGAGAVRSDTTTTTGRGGMCFSYRSNLSYAKAETKSPPGDEIRGLG